MCILISRYQFIRFILGLKRQRQSPLQYSTLQKSIVSSVLECFQCYYIPSNKSIAQLYDEFVSPFVKKQVAEALKPYDLEIRKSISSLTDSMDKELAESGLSKVNSYLEYPRNALEHLISGFELMVHDTSKSSIFTKGMGLSLLFFFLRSSGLHNKIQRSQ